VQKQQTLLRTSRPSSPLEVLTTRTPPRLGREPGENRASQMPQEPSGRRPPCDCLAPSALPVDPTQYR
jgi:hypothetical protein